MEDISAPSALELNSYPPKSNKNSGQGQPKIINIISIGKYYFLSPNPHIRHHFDTVVVVVDGTGVIRNSPSVVKYL